jgi:hypothetical protein
LSDREPRNPWYWLLLAASLAFVVTALAYAIVPSLEEWAADVGQPSPPSPFREELRHNGWRWLLAEVGAIVIFAVLSMILDRRRSLRQTASARPGGD